MQNAVKAQGVRASIGQFATGNPDCTNSTVLEAFNPAIDAAMRHDGIMGLHEYSSPLLSGCFSGSPQNGSGWMTGRYRSAYFSLWRNVVEATLTPCVMQSGTNRS